MTTAYFPYAPTVRRKLALRTFLLPLVAILVHSLTQAVVSLLYLIISQLVALANGGGTSAEFILTNHFDSSSLVAPLGLSALVQILLYSLTILFLTKREPFYAGLLPRRKSDAPLGILMALGALALAQFIVLGITVLAENLPFFADILSDYSTHSEATVSSNLFLDFMVVVVLVPLAEELLFRGLLVGELRRVVGSGVSIWVGGLVFALVHFNPVQIIYVIPAGLIFAAAYVYTDSLLLSTVMHMVYNFFGSIFPSLIHLDALVESDDRFGLVYLLIQVVLLLVGIIALIFLRRRYKKGKKQALYRLTPVDRQDPVGLAQV